MEAEETAPGNLYGHPTHEVASLQEFGPMTRQWQVEY
jgi:hypothetical protein